MGDGGWGMGGVGGGGWRGMVMKLAAKCIDDCVVWEMGWQSILQMCSEIQCSRKPLKPMPQHIPRNVDKPNMFVQFAPKCIDYCLVCCRGGG